MSFLQIIIDDFSKIVKKFARKFRENKREREREFYIML